jgi:hypothetical protein
MATVTTLVENGAVDKNGNIDQATLDKITSSLENNVQNSPQRKIYILSDLKITNDESATSIKKYSAALKKLQPKGQVKYTVPDILNKFAPDDTGNNIDPSVLPELDPIIKQMNDLMNGMIKTNVPSSLASLHLNSINAMEAVMENLNDVKLYDTDPIVAFSGMVKYQTNTNILVSTTKNLNAAINSKLKILN